MPSKGSTASNAETTRRQEGAGASPVAVSPPPGLRRPRAWSERGRGGSQQVSAGDRERGGHGHSSTRSPPRAAPLPRGAQPRVRAAPAPGGGASRHAAGFDRPAERCGFGDCLRARSAPEAGANGGGRTQPLERGLLLK